MKLLTLAVCLSCFAQQAWAYYIPPEFSEAWRRSWLVVAGNVTKLANSPPDTAFYALSIEATYKGSFQKSQLEFLDPGYRSDASLGLGPGESYLLFVASPAEIYSTANSGTNAQSNRVRLAIPWNKQTKPELEAAINQLENYWKFTNRGEKIPFLLSQLEKPNKNLNSFVEREILLLQVTEAIPLFRQRLNAATNEFERLHAARHLRGLDDRQIVPQFLLWLKDPDWKQKVDALIELEKMQPPESLVPLLRSLINADDPLLAVEARSALFRRGERDGKALLFEVLATSTDAVARYNAIHPLNWFYQGSFTEAEITTLKKLLNDKDETIRRVAGFIVQKTPSK
jgi:hypothetical protein